MVSVDLIAMVTSEASDGHERRLRAKVTSEASYGYERSELWSCSMTLLWRKVLECSSSLLTSSSLCPHSLRHPCVLTPMTCLLTHLIVIPDFSLESSHPSHP